jgi:hypothetical protein
MSQTIVSWSLVPKRGRVTSLQRTLLDFLQETASLWRSGERTCPNLRHRYKFKHGWKSSLDTASADNEFPLILALRTS